MHEIAFRFVVIALTISIIAAGRDNLPINPVEIDRDSCTIRPAFDCSNKHFVALVFPRLYSLSLFLPIVTSFSHERIFLLVSFPLILLSPQTLSLFPSTLFHCFHRRNLSSGDEDNIHSVLQTRHDRRHRATRLNFPCPHHRLSSCQEKHMTVYFAEEYRGTSEPIKRRRESQLKEPVSLLSFTLPLSSRTYRLSLQRTVITSNFKTLIKKRHWRADVTPRERAHL